MVLVRLAGTSGAGVDLEVPAKGTNVWGILTSSIRAIGGDKRNDDRGKSGEVHGETNLVRDDGQEVKWLQYCVCVLTVEVQV
jgi:hypothetical protein